MVNPRAEKKQIKDLMTLTTDLFGYINYDLTDLEISKEMLNFYFMSKYSNRWISPVMELLIEDGTIPAGNWTVLGNYLNQLFKNKWDRLKNIILLEYDPIHNYSDTMSEDITDNDDKSVTLDLDGTNTNTRTDNTTETTSNTRTDNTTRTDNLTRTDDLEMTKDVGTTNGNTDSVYGFNSSNAVPSDESESSGSVDETDTQTGTVKNAGTVTNTGTVANAGTKQNTGTVGNSGSNTVDSTEQTYRDFTRERSVTHIGNIGNLSTQNLLTQEVEFWNWNFIIQMLSDVADVLTLPIY